MLCNTVSGVTPSRKVATFRVDADLLAGMETLKDRDGIPLSEQIRRALREWLTGKGVIKADRPRAVTRKRS
jgi:hypothetical protein